MLKRRWLLAIVAVPIVAIVAVAAGWYFLVREDAELATSAPDIPADLVDDAPATPASGDAGSPATDSASGDGDMLTLHVVSDLSEAAYFVDEELASLPLPSTAKGATTDIQGEFHLTSDGLALAEGTASTFTVDLTTLTSDESRRDTRVQGALQTSQFPTATFLISDVSGYDPSIPEGEEQTLSMTGTLDLHGVQRELTWEVKAKRENNVISALATVTFLFSDFDITPPNIGGFVSVADEATLQVQIVAERV